MQWDKQKGINGQSFCFDSGKNFLLRKGCRHAVADIRPIMRTIALAGAIVPAAAFSVGGSRCANAVWMYEAPHAQLPQSGLASLFIRIAVGIRSKMMKISVACARKIMQCSL